MDESLTGQNVGSSLPVPALVAAVIAVVVVVMGLGAFLLLPEIESRHEVTVATGTDGGTYHAFGIALARVLEAEKVIAEGKILTTAGSVANMELISDPQSGVDLAFVQSDTPPSTRARLVMPLYNEVLHILVARDVADEIQTIFDLRGRRVALGPMGSGTRQLSERLLEHFNVVVGEDLDVTAQAAAEGLKDGSVDVAFILTAIPSRLVNDLGMEDAVRFLSLGDAQEYGNEADALALVFPSIRGTTIPRSTYVRVPERPVRTIEVSAMLIARRDLDPELVRSITEGVIEHRSGSGGLEGEELVVARRIREDYRPGTYQIPYHDGAINYYLREEPAFFVEYAEAISLGLTLLVGAYSGYIALREWMRRRMKNRIDAYLIEVERQTEDLDSLSLSQLIELRKALDDVRQRAFSDLVSERVQADQAFTIFQNHLRDEFAEIDVRIKEKKLSA